MIRVTKREDGPNTIVQIAGRLEEHRLAELQEHFPLSGIMLVIDLSELQSADHGSIKWLHDVVDQGAAITGASPYIELLFERAKNQKRSGKPTEGSGQ